MPKTIGHEVSFSRIQKMAKLRNIYLDYIKTHYSDFDYMLVYDFDIIGQLYKDGVKDTFRILNTVPEINAITANGVRKGNNLMGSQYYDPFAIFGMTSPSCFENEAAKRQDEQRLIKGGFIPSESDTTFRFKSGFGLIPVKSAFAGLAVFRIEPIIRTGASYDLTCPKITCEHTALAESIGGVYINPKMVLYVYKH